MFVFEYKYTRGINMCTTCRRERQKTSTVKRSRCQGASTETNTGEGGGGSDRVLAVFVHVETSRELSRGAYSRNEKP